MYGLTECKRCTYLPPRISERKPTSVGIAIPNTELWIVGEDGEQLGPGEVGQLVIRGATVMSGYWEKPEATAKKLRPGPLPGEQVLYTGDFCQARRGGLPLLRRPHGQHHQVPRREGGPRRRSRTPLMNIAGVKEASSSASPTSCSGRR